MGGGVVEVDIGMAWQPAVVLGLVGVQVVEDDVEFLIGVFGGRFVHKAQKLASFARRISGITR